MKTTITLALLLACTAAGAIAADAKAGQATYTQSCKNCHGVDGAGNPAIAKMMKVEMKALSSPAVQAMSDADLKKIITGGQGKMKPVALAAGGSADDVVAYLRTLKP